MNSSWSLDARVNHAKADYVIVRDGLVDLGVLLVGDLRRRGNVAHNALALPIDLLVVVGEQAPRPDVLAALFLLRERCELGVMMVTP